jgi:Domain of unknown function (DUF4149)
VLWAGSLWSVAAWVAPTLFYMQSDRHLAGVLAARLFSIETYLTLAISAVVLAAVVRARFKTLYAAAVLLGVNEWLLKPLMEQARTSGAALGLGFGPWHGISALLYLAACVLALVLVWNDDLR